MLKSNKLIAAIAALFIFLCCAVVPAAEGVPAPDKSYAEMTVDEMVEYFKKLQPNQVAAVIGEIMQNESSTTIDVAGQAIAIYRLSLDEEARTDLTAQIYEATREVVVKDDGTFIPTGSFLTADMYYLNVGNSMAAFAAGNNNVHANSELVNATIGGSVEIPQRHDPFSKKASR